MHVEEPVHGPALLRLFDLQLRQEVDKPLEGPLVPVDPEEVDLLEVEDGGGRPVGPLVAALGAGVPHLPELVHDGLEDGGERGHPDPRANQHGVLGAKNLAGRGAEGPVNVNLSGIEPKYWYGNCNI